MVKSLNIKAVFRLVIAVVGVLHSGIAVGQNSIASGNWNATSTWSCNCIPTAANNLTIQAAHTVTIPAAYAATAASLIVNGTLVNSSAIAPTIAGTITVSGTYDHNINAGTIPTATWNSGSTCRVTGTTTTVPLGLTQTFHHFTWDCAAQVSPTLILGGNLATVNGNLRVANTNGNKQITLGGNTIGFTGALAIGGSLLVESGRVQLGGTGTYTVTIGDDFNVSATSQIPNPPGAPVTINNVILSSSATVNVTVNEDVIISGNGRFNMLTASGAQSNLNIKGDLLLTNGTFMRDVASSDGSSVNVTFNGTTASPQLYTGGGTFSGKPINYRVASTADLNLQTFGLGLSGSTFTSDGIVRLASVDPTSAIAGNIPPSTRTFNSGSTIIYSGAAEQFIGGTHPSGTGITTTITNTNGLTLTSNATIGGTLNLTSGDIDILDHRLTLNGTLNAGTHHLNITDESSLEIGGTGAFGVVPFAGGTTISNFTIARTSGSVIFEQDLTLDGALTQTAGDIHLDGTDLVLTGDFARTAGTIVSDDPASTFTIQADGDVPATAAFSGSFASFDFNREAVTMATTSSPFSVQNLYLRRGTLNNTSDLSITSGGTIQKFVGSLGSPVGGTGPLFITFSNDEDVLSSAELTPVNNRVEDVLVNGSANVLLADNFTANGDFEIASGGFFAQDRTVTLEGDLIINGFADFGQSTLIFDGSTTISGTVPPFGTMQVTSGSSLTLPSDETIFIAGDVNFSATSTVNAPNLSVTLNGATLQTLSPNGLSVNTLTVSKSDDSDVALAGDLLVVGDVQMPSPNTDLASNGFLRLISTSDAGGTSDAWIGQLLDGASVSGDVHVQRFMSDEGSIYRYLSSPVANFTVDELNNFIPIAGPFVGSSVCTNCGSLNSMFWYNNAINNYTAFPASSINEDMEVGKGYSTYIFRNSMPAGPVTLDFTGQVNQGPLPLTLGYNNAVPTESWNLIGNPYPATIDWDDDTGGWTKGSSIATTGIAVRDNGAGGVFRYWDGEDGALTGGLIAKGQAFWVRTVDNSDLTLDINELAKASPTPAPFLRTAGTTMDGFILTLTDGTGIADKAYVKERAEAKLAVDRFDIPKLNNQFFDLSTYAFEGTRTPLAINAVNHVDCIERVGLVIKDMTAGNYTLKVDLSGKFASRNWTLLDKFTNTTQAFNSDTYAFAVTTAAASKAVDRFEMILDTERPRLDLDVVATTPNVCTDAAVITIPDAQPGFSYGLVVNGVATGDEFTGSSNLAIKLDNSLMQMGANNIQVAVIGGCPQNLAKAVSVKKHEIVTATTTSRMECVPGSYKIDADGANNFKWYGSSDGPVIGQGKTFTTPTIGTTTSYYVAAVNDNGCEGPRVPVTITINFTEAVAISIQPEDDVKALLVSNYADGNQWSFNGVAIDGATGQALEVDKTGRYTLAVSQNGCTQSGSVDYAITGLERDPATAVAWPNPVSGKLTIDIPSTLIVKSLWLQTTSGAIADKHNNPSGSVTIDMEQYTPGFYFLVMDTDRGRKVQKVIRN